MRKCGIVITVFYAVVLVLLLTPVSLYIVEPGVLKELGPNVYSSWAYWGWIAFLVGGQALLLFLSVDTSQKRLRPRRHVALSISFTALLLSILTFAAILSLAIGVGDELSKKVFFSPHTIFGVKVGEATILIVNLLVYWVGPWILWGIVFYMYLRDEPALIKRLMSWLLTGSVLELLIAVPSHILVRQRGECSAPMATSFGIVTGLAIMLLSFGPGILFLYKKRLDQYKKRTPTIGTAC